MPINSNPHTLPFEISGAHLQGLTPGTYAELLRRLLCAEATAHGLPMDSIHVASNVNAPDGGEDGYIGWTGGPDRTGFLPCRKNQFQLKCGEVFPKSAGCEVLAGKGQVKSMVRDVLGNGGCYTLLSNRPYTRRAIKEREKRISAALRKANLTVNEGQVRFRDADWIATWANRYPSVAAWAKELTQPGTVGPFRPWDHWAGSSEHQLSPWVDDDRLVSLRASVLQRITQEHGVIYIRGVPGVGKSRLVLEALRSADDGNLSIRGLVMYADEADDTVREIRETAETLAVAGSRAILVIDRCTPRTRRAVAGAVKRPGSRLSLVTIEDEALSMPPDPETLVVPEAPPEVTAKMVEQLAPNLPSEDNRRLQLLSRGFPGHTLAVVKAWKDSVQPPHATEDDIVEAFVVGRDTSQANLLMASARLLAVFGALRLGPPPEQDQLSEVARFRHDLVDTGLRAGVQLLVSRGVVKKFGGLVVFSPSPIALNLAEYQWREWAQDRWDEILAGSISPELKEFAARRLALLNTTGISQQVAAHLCRYGGPLEVNIRDLRASHAEVLTALVQINASQVVALLERCLSVVDLSEIKDEVRTKIARTLEQAAFQQDAFEDAASLLLDLAATESELHGSRATEAFRELFPLLLGKTEAPGSSRLAFLDAVAQTTSPRHRQVIVRALVAGIETQHFHRDVGAETHGLRPTLQSWRPTTTAEATAYVTGCVERLANFAIANDPAGKAARIGLGDRLRSLIWSGLIDIDIVERVVARIQGNLGAPWQGAIRSLNRFVRFDAKKVSPDLVNRVKALAATLQPSDLKPRALHLISQYVGDYSPREQSDDFDATRKRLMGDIRRVAEELVSRPTTLTSVLPEASSGPQMHAEWFGECIAEAAESPADWLEPVKAAFVGAPEAVRNSNLLAGFLYGLSKTHPSDVIEFKRMAARSAQFAPTLPDVCGHCGLTPDDIVLVTEALRGDLLTPLGLMRWTLAAARDKLSPSDLAPLLDALLDRGREGFPVAAHLIYTYVCDAPDGIDGLWPQVSRAAEGVTRWVLAEGDGLTEYAFESLMMLILKRGRQDPKARALALTLAGAFVESLGTGNEQLVKPLLPCLLSEFPEIAWPLIGQAAISETGPRWILESELREKPSPDTEARPAILDLPLETLFAWCQAHPDSAPAVVAATMPFLETDDEGAPISSLHPVMKRLLDEFGHCPGVPEAVSRNMGSFSWMGSATSVLQLYREPLAALQDHAKREVRKWARAKLREVEDRIQAAKAMDAEWKARTEI